MMKRLALCFLQVALLAGGGCGNNDPGGKALVGYWQIVDSTGVMAQQVTFRQDGSFTLVIHVSRGTDEHVSGKYETGGHDLILDGINGKDSKRTRVTGQYYVTATKLALYVIYPQDAHQGIVGTWAGTLLFEGLDSAGKLMESSQLGTTYVFRADNTVTETSSTIGQRSTPKDGTWAAAGPSNYLLTFPAQGGAGSETVSVLDDAVLSGPAFQRTGG